MELFIFIHVLGTFSVEEYDVFAARVDVPGAHARSDTSGSDRSGRKQKPDVSLTSSQEHEAVSECVVKVRQKDLTLKNVIVRFKNTETLQPADRVVTPSAAGRSILVEHKVMNLSCNVLFVRPCHLSVPHHRWFCCTPLVHAVLSLF